MAAKVVSRDEWLVARKELLVKEKEDLRASDALAEQRRALPMVKIDKDYEFQGPNGKASLLDLFAGRKQLIVYHFMFSPGDTSGCPGCSFFVDHIPHLAHLQSRDTSFVVVSRGTIEQIDAFKKKMGWTFPWYSSFGSDFNYDYHVSIDKDVAPVMLNFRQGDELVTANGDRRGAKGDCPGLSVFYNEGKEVYHSYSTYERGVDRFLNTHALLDVTPLGRQDAKYTDGWELHDEYDQNPKVEL